MLALRLPKFQGLRLGGLQETQIVFFWTAILVIAALAFILRYSVNAPYVDEWDLTHVVLGGMTMTQWSFTRLNEHYFIPANALWYAVLKASALNFRAGMLVNLALMTGAVGLFLRSVRRIRGRLGVSDLVLPAILLHAGHAYNLLMSYQIVFGFFALSIAMLVTVVASAEPGREARTAWRASLVLLVVMLNGGMGLAFVPAISLWILALAWRARALAPIGILLSAWTYTFFAMMTTPDVAATPRDSIPIDRLAWCVVQYLGIGTGLWYDGPHWPRNGILIAAGYGIVLTILSALTLSRRDGGRVTGLLALLIGHFCVAGGIALSRGGGIAERYVTLSALGLALAWVGLVAWRPEARILKWLGISAAILFFVVNLGPGRQFGREHRAVYTQLESDVRAGMPIPELTEKYKAILRVGDNLTPALQRLHRHRVGFFQHAVP